MVLQTTEKAENQQTKVPDVLAEAFDTLVDAPNGIPKLREMILDLAVRGKLVPQDPNDEPASELLERIEKEREKYAAENMVSTPKNLPLIAKHEMPYDIPANWNWVRIGNICHHWGQIQPETSFTYIDVNAINQKTGEITNPSTIEPENAPSRARKIIEPGTVIYSTVRPYLLNVAVVNENFTPKPIASTAFAVVHPLCSVSSRFLFWCFRSPYFIRYVEACQNGVAYPAINNKQFFSALVPLAPAAEQKRIVAKIDSLMAICDKLESQLETSTSISSNLATAIAGKIQT